MLSISLSYIAFIMLRNVSFIPRFFRAFIMKGCWILSMDFLHLLIWCGFCPWFCLCVVLCSFKKILLLCWIGVHCGNYKGSYSVSYLNSPCITFVDLWMLSHPCIPWKLDLFNVLLDSVSKYFIEGFWIYVHQGYWL
jgi:hypothetical protein